METSWTSTVGNISEIQGVTKINLQTSPVDRTDKINSDTLYNCFPKVARYRVLKS